MGRLLAIDCQSMVTGTAVRRGVAEFLDSENNGLIHKSRANKRIPSNVGRVDWLTFIGRDGVSEASTKIALLTQLFEMAASCSVFVRNHTHRLTKGCRFE